MSGGMRRGGIPGPESRTGLVRPMMTEAEFETPATARRDHAARRRPVDAPTAVRAEVDRLRAGGAPVTVGAAARACEAREAADASSGCSRIEEELDKKLWLYAIHLGKDRSEVVNDLLRPLVASMVLYDSRDRRAARAAETADNDEAAA